MKLIFYISFFIFGLAGASFSDPLPSWENTATKTKIFKFVQRVNSQAVPARERIAVFDNDGTLWTEQPFYIQGLFMFDRIRALAPQHPEWKTKQPYKGIIENDRNVINKLSESDFAELMAATHSGMTVEEFQRIAKQWLNTAVHPRYKKLYKECTYKPMVELLEFLRAQKFKTFIVSGGGIDFLRVFAEEAYGVPPEQVVGSSGKTLFQKKSDENTDLLKLPEINLISDGPGKPVAIHLNIGHRPILAFGNSDGDLQMLEYTASNKLPNLMLILHHDDPVRETAYDRQSPVGRLDKAWDEALRRNWIVVSMKNDFKSVFNW